MIFTFFVTFFDFSRLKFLDYQLVCSKSFVLLTFLFKIVKILDF